MRIVKQLAKDLAPVALLASTTAAHTQPISSQGWKQHPEVLEVRKIYQAANAEVSAETIPKWHRTGDHCRSEQGGTASKTLWTMSNKQPRVYVVIGGTEDMAVTWRSYYDTQGRPRFVHVSHNDVRGGQIEYRAYLRPGGSVIHFEQKIVRPGSPPYGVTEVLQEFIFRPIEDFRSNICS